jgi:hypothetical protein
MNTTSLITSSGRGGHSARVDMRLLVNGYTLSVRQMGSDFVLLDEPVSHPPASATILLRVDDTEETWPVRLPEGITAGIERVAIEAVI